MSVFSLSPVLVNRGLVHPASIHSLVVFSYPTTFKLIDILITIPVPDHLNLIMTDNGYKVERDTPSGTTMQRRSCEQWRISFVVGYLSSVSTSIALNRIHCPIVRIPLIQIESSVCGFCVSTQNNAGQSEAESMSQSLSINMTNHISVDISFRTGWILRLFWFLSFHCPIDLFVNQSLQTIIIIIIITGIPLTNKVTRVLRCPAIYQFNSDHKGMTMEPLRRLFPNIYPQLRGPRRIPPDSANNILEAP